MVQAYFVMVSTGSIPVTKAQLVFMKIEFIKRAQKQRKDSFWYDGTVAIVTDKRTIHIIAQGEINVVFNENEDWYSGKQAVKEARKRNYTDRKLNNLVAHDGWGNNNWFAFWWEEGDKYLTPTSVHYTEAIKIAIDLAKNKRHEKI